MTVGEKGDRLARAVGMLVFLAGLGIIGWVLRLALHLYHDPNLGSPVIPAGPNTPSLSNVGIGFGRLVVRILLLFLGSICGWFIAGRGVMLYMCGRGSARVEKRETSDSP